MQMFTPKIVYLNKALGSGHVYGKTIHPSDATRRIGFFGVDILHLPSRGYFLAVFIVLLRQRFRADECSVSGDCAGPGAAVSIDTFGIPLHPFGEVDLDLGDVFAIVEHIRITVFDQCGGRQFRRLRQAGTFTKHIHVAGLGQFRGGQFRRLRQSTAIVKHICVAICGQCGGREFRGLSQAGAVIKHSVVATASQHCGRELRGLSQISATVKHSTVASTVQ